MRYSTCTRCDSQRSLRTSTLADPCHARYTWTACAPGGRSPKSSANSCSNSAPLPGLTRQRETDPYIAVLLGQVLPCSSADAPSGAPESQPLMTSSYRSGVNELDVKYRPSAISGSSESRGCGRTEHPTRVSEGS